MDLGNHIKELRNLRGYSIRKLASESGLSAGYLSRIEKGEIKNPKKDNLVKISKGLDITLLDLLSVDGIIPDIDELMFMFTEKENEPKSIYQHAKENGISMENLDNLKKYFDENGFQQYPKISKRYEIEVVFHEKTLLEYKGDYLNEDEKQEILNFIEYVYQKKKQNESDS